MLHLNVSEGVCVEVSDERSWSLGTAADRGDGVPSPVRQGSALLFLTKNLFFFFLLKLSMARRPKTSLQGWLKPFSEHVSNICSCLGATALKLVRLSSKHCVKPSL